MNRYVRLPGGQDRIGAFAVSANRRQDIFALADAALSPFSHPSAAPSHGGGIAPILPPTFAEIDEPVARTGFGRGGQVLTDGRNAVL